MANWRRRGEGIELRVYAGHDPVTGRERRATKTIPLVGKREADRQWALFAAEVAGGGEPVCPGRRTFGALMEAWFDKCAPDWSPGTAYQTRWMIDHRLAGLSGRPLRALDTAVLDRFYTELRKRGGRGGRPLAVSSVVRVHGIVRLALDQAVRWRWLAANPADAANPGKLAKRLVVQPDADAIRRLLMAAAEDDPELFCYLFLDAETGARRGELAALRLDDFGADEVTLARTLVVGLLTEENLATYAGHIWPSAHERGERRTALIEKGRPKNHESVRTIAVCPATAQLVGFQEGRLRDRAARDGVAYPDNGFLFPADIAGARPLRADTWTHRFIRLRDRLGLSLRLHDVRHFVATTLLTSGVDLATVAGRLGHGGGGKTTLAIYAHFVKAPDRAASEVMAGVLDLRVGPGSPAPADSAVGSNVVPFRRREDAAGVAQTPTGDGIKPVAVRRMPRQPGQ